MSIYTIYRATNTLNQKVYIGYTSKTLSRRKQQHLEWAARGSKSKFHTALRKYSEDVFHWEVIYQSVDKDHCKNEMESHFISIHNSSNSGYNGTSGGDGIDSAAMKAIRNNPDSVYNSAEYKRKRSLIQKEVRKDPNSKFNSGDFKEKVSANMHRLHDDPNSTFNTAEYKKKLSEGAKRFWAKRKALLNK